MHRSGVDVRRYGLQAHSGDVGSIPAFDSTKALWNYTRIVAMIAAALTAPTAHLLGTGCRIFFPEGLFDFSDTVRIISGCLIEGCGGGDQYGATRWRFPSGKTGVVFDYQPGVGIASGAVMRDLCILSSDNNRLQFAGGAFPQWRPSTVVATGERKVRLTLPVQLLNEARLGVYSWGYHLQCVAGGTTGAGEPNWSWVETPETRYFSAVTNASPIAITTTFDHTYLTGDKVYISGVLGNTAANGTWTITKVDATHFTLDSSTGNGAYTSGGQGDRAYVDGTVTWILSNDGHGIVYHAPLVSVENVFVSGFPGNGHHLHASAVTLASDPWNHGYNANATAVRGGSVNDCGGSGIFTYGGDVNGCRFRDINIANCRGHGVNDWPSAANHYQGLLTDVCEMGSFASDGSHFFGNYNEGAQPPAILLRSAVWFAGTIGADVGGGQNFSGRWNPGAKVKTFSPNLVVEVNDFILPTTPNGYAYWVHDIGSAPHQLGATEPDWPLGFGWAQAPDRTNFTSGNCQLQCRTWDTNTIPSDGRVHGGSVIGNSPATFESFNRGTDKINTYFMAGVAVGESQQGRDAWGWYSDTVDSGNSWKMRHAAGYGWLWGRTGAVTVSPLGFTTSDASEGAGHLIMPEGYFLMGAKDPAALPTPRSGYMFLVNHGGTFKIKKDDGSVKTVTVT